jgi:hypothetical protein
MQPSFGNTGIAAAGSLAGVAGGISGLTVVDVSNPTMPVPVGMLANGGSFRDITMDNTQYAYALVQVPGNPGFWELEVVDLRTPQAPAILGRITLAGGGGVKVVGTRVYVAAGSAGLQIVNVTNPNSPSMLSTIDTPGAAGGVAVANGYAYVADNTTLKVINVQNPSNPSIVGSLTTSAAHVAVSGNRAYVLGGGELKIIDVTNPATPVLLSTSYSYNGQDIDASGGLAFLAAPGDKTFGGLYVVEVSNPLAPTLLERIVVPGFVQSVCANGTMVYTSDSASITNVIQITP